MSIEKVGTMENPIFYLVTFAIAFIVSLLMTPMSKVIAFKIGAVDRPKSRGMHSKTMPLAGGLSIILGFYVAIIVVMFMRHDLNMTNLLGLLIGGIIIGILGLFDDMKDLSPKLRLVIQLSVAILVVSSGVYIQQIAVPFTGHYLRLQGLPGQILTIIWIIGVTNAVNWIDGLDGLATGVSSIASLSLMFLALLNVNNIPGGPIAVILTAALSGACLGFLPHNFNPATIFMGSTGSTFLGFVLAVLSIQNYQKSQTALVIAVLILGLPIFDTLFAIIRRILTKKPIMVGDRGHIHHRLVDKGYSHKNAVLILYVVSGCFGIAGILFAETEVILAVIMVAGLLYFLLKDQVDLKKLFHDKE